MCIRDRFHIGHIMEYIQADIWVRFQRMRGHSVHYVCADDTHGTPVMLRAEKEGLTPEQLIERVHGGDHDVAAPLQRGELGPFAERRLDAVHAATGECAAGRLQVDGIHV